MKIIEIKGLKKNYMLGKTIVPALRGIDLEVLKGDLLGVVGPSGSGKTTLLNIIGCIDSATEGIVKIANKDISSLNDKEITNIRLHHIGFIFQTFNLIAVLNVLENVEFPLLLMKNKSRKEIRKKAMEFIDAVGLSDHIKHKPAELSGGQRQRVAIARALVTNPDIVLADEPTANLDSATGASILELMKEMNRKENTTFLFSTHDPAVLQYAKAIVKLRDGMIVKDS